MLGCRDPGGEWYLFFTSGLWSGCRIRSVRTHYFVKPEEADLARRIENKLMALPLSSGLLFVGVSIMPGTAEEVPVYRVWVGCHRDFDEALMDPLVRVTLREEIESGIRLTVEAHRGLSRSPVAKLVDAAQ